MSPFIKKSSGKSQKHLYDKLLSNWSSIFKECETDILHIRRGIFDLYHDMKVARLIYPILWKPNSDVRANTMQEQLHSVEKNPIFKLPLFFISYTVRKQTRQFQSWNYFGLNGVVLILYLFIARLVALWYKDNYRIASNRRSSY